MTARSQAGVPGTMVAGSVILSEQRGARRCEKSRHVCGKVVMAAGQADFDVRDLADEAVAHDLRRLAESAAESAARSRSAR